MNFSVTPIDYLETPFGTVSNTPIQLLVVVSPEGKAILYHELVAGLEDLDGFSHIILLFLLHKVEGYQLEVVPFMDNVPRGVSAIRLPKRPNRVGMSIVRLERIEDNIIYPKGMDMLNGSPLPDIRSYYSYFDNCEDIRNGWLERKVLPPEKLKPDNRFNNK